LSNARLDGVNCAELTVGSPATATIYNDDTPTEIDPCEPTGAPIEVDEGVDWLARHQADNGSWSMLPSQHPNCNGSCANDSTIGTPCYNAATGLALLPLLGSGSTPASGPHADAVCRGLSFLLSRQAGDGSLADPLEPGGYLYSHLIASAALAEAALMEKLRADESCPPEDPEDQDCTLAPGALLAATQKAVDWALSAQATSGYGWKYVTGGSEGNLGDLSHHVWGVTLLMTAKEAGANVSDASLATMTSFLNSVEMTPKTTDGGVTLGYYRYYTGSVSPYNQVTISMTSAGLLSRVLLGVSPSHAFITNYKNQSFVQVSPGAVYYNFHTTQLLHHAGGTAWSNWNTAMRSHLNSTRATTGHAAGSWYFPSSSGPAAQSFDGAKWNPYGGRMYCTVFALLSLEENFRGLRLSN
jgi:hypothetical protein